MEGNVKSRMLAFVVVVVMLLSSVMVFSNTMASTYKEMDKYSQVPGVDVWAACNWNVYHDSSENVSVLNTSTADLYYGQTVSIKVNGSLSWGSTTYYVWYPIYTGGLGYSYNLTWARWKPASGPQPTVNKTNGDTTFENVNLNRSGLWIIDSASNHDASNYSNMNQTIPAWFWVNSSQALVTSVSDASAVYGEKKTITVNVKKDGEGIPCIVDVRAFSDNKTIFSAGNAWTTTGAFTFQADATNFSHIGTYNIYAYKDVDSDVIYYKENPVFYNDTYGKMFTPSGAGYYNYTWCGPWDPPEYNQSSIKDITVTKGKPTITATNTSEVYWGFDANLEVNITDPYGNGLDNLSALKIKNREGKYFDNTTDPTNLSITTAAGAGNYTISFARGSANWTRLYDTYCNGTWKIVFGWDTNDDGSQEWNNSLSFSVKSKAPAVRIDLVNYTDMKIDVPKYYPYGGQNGTTDVHFIVYGGAVDGPKAYYGDDANEDEKNITVSGDILYPAILEYNNSADYGWDAYFTPTKPGGTIIIAVDWEGNGTDSVTIDIVNGTTVTPSIDSFAVGKNVTLTVTVKSMTGSLQEYANVTLFWGDWRSGLGGTGVGEVINSTDGNGAVGNGANGEYTFIISTSDQRGIAPQNITIAAKTPTVNYWGYAKVLMDRNHDLVVNCTPTVSYAGDSTEYNIYVTTMAGGKPTEDSTLFVKLYNETGALSDQWSGADASNTIEDESIPLAGGTYHFYAYNDTHDSQGHNVTIVVTKYSVTSSPSVLAWLIDTSQNMTFQVIPAGNGTLTVKNMSGLPNASAVGDSYDVEINNGVGTLDEVNATTLGNVTFEYTPEDGVLKPAEGSLKVTTATAIPSPATVYIGEATTVEITVTHPATGLPLKGVRIGLDHGMNLSSSLLNKFPADEFTDADGKVYFAIETGGSGDITIYMNNQTDPDNAFVIKSAAKKTMKIYADPSVNEGETFTVTAKSNGVVITDATVTMKFAGTTLTTTDGTVEFTAPSVQESLDYRIEASVEGYTSDDTTIKILNIPKLVIAPSSTEVNANSQVDITVADDSGNAIIGATVTFNDKTYTTGAGGTVAVTVPSKAGDYTITATKTGFADADPVTITIKEGGTPGFELVTLIAALGVAFILLRRRRN